MRENPLTRLTKRIARYSYGIYLLHYFAIWFGFVVCRKLNLGLQITIFASLLILLSVLLYRTVEKPLITAGVNVAEKFTRREYTFRSEKPFRRGRGVNSVRSRLNHRENKIRSTNLLHNRRNFDGRIVGAGDARFSRRAWPMRGKQPAPQLQTAADINQSLLTAREKLAASAAASQAGDSRIGPDDLLNITIFEAPEMNSTVRVSASGEISLQLMGPVHAGGLTPRELELMLQSQLRRTYMKDPHVGVFIQELQSHAVSVVGAVKMPGVFQIRGPKTLLEILSLAQGLADDAGDTVLILHRRWRAIGVKES